MKKINLSTFNGIIREYYEVGALSDADYSKYNLICRYNDKVSKRLLDEKEILRKKGKEAFNTLLRAMIYKSNSFLNLIPKTGGLGTAYIPCPIKYGKD